MKVEGLDMLMLKGSTQNSSYETGGNLNTPRPRIGYDYLR